ncbi:hypothetical protein OA84_09360 [Kaistella solincola]|uniref:Uncharacterized protein n=3 Tax=Chryseobacterium group TaxID=2782232 RepID=A0A1I3JJU1_9FLAO|nr:hypothetical protein [Kaistella solincola]KIA83678.1 hypothetical protein OA84_09360 [Kaistella solincola]SFI60533.1 hypothetical protein SAMN05421638_0221 [Kaistella treverensis]
MERKSGVRKNNVNFEEKYSMENIQPENGKNSKFRKWFKRVGIGGLIFFTVKGIAWLFVFYYGAELFQDCSAK